MMYVKNTVLGSLARDYMTDIAILYLQSIDSHGTLTTILDSNSK
jgi:hypothetical protein